MYSSILALVFLLKIVKRSQSFAPELRLFNDPFSFEYDKAPVEYQLVLIELQSREGLKTFHRENALLLFYKKLHSLKNEFNQILNLSRKLL